MAKPFTNELASAWRKPSHYTTLPSFFSRYSIYLGTNTSIMTQNHSASLIRLLRGKRNGLYYTTHSKVSYPSNNTKLVLHYIYIYKQLYTYRYIYISKQYYDVQNIYFLLPLLLLGGSIPSVILFFTLDLPSLVIVSALASTYT